MRRIRAPWHWVFGPGDIHRILRSYFIRSGYDPDPDENQPGLPNHGRRYPLHAKTVLAQSGLWGCQSRTIGPTFVAIPEGEGNFPHTLGHSFVSFYFLGLYIGVRVLTVGT